MWIIYCILAILILFFIYFLSKQKVAKMKKIANMKKITNMKSVVILKSHVWNDNLGKFAQKIKNETSYHKIDFFIIIHSDDKFLIKMIPLSLKNNVLCVTTNIISNLYEVGFYNMWLSNHWILMWFFKNYSNYDYYWSIEYDVRITGDSSKLWTYSGKEDFIYPIKTFQAKYWTWKDYYTGTLFQDKDKWYGYLQLARYSSKFLSFLDFHFLRNENGQDELIIFTLLHYGKSLGILTGSERILNSAIHDSWSVDANDSEKHKKYIVFRKNNKELAIYHPVKYS